MLRVRAAIIFIYKASMRDTNIGAKRSGLLEEKLAVGTPRLFILEDGPRPRVTLLVTVFT